jgi:guanylate kinase
MSNDRPGRLLIVSAPSGAGKTTVVRRMVTITPRVAVSRSYTSRSIRVGEVDGVDYNFVSAARFVAMREAGALLEWAEIFGDLYGTGRADTERCLASGDDLVLVIDVQGAHKVRVSGLPNVSVFLMPPSRAALEARLRGRGRDGEEAIRRRLATATREVSAVSGYDYVIVNDEVNSCADCLRSIVLAERARREAMTPEIAAITATFGT